MEGKRVLVVGMGNLGSQVLNALVRVPGNHRFLVGGRNLDSLQQQVNLATFAAVQLGYDPDVAYTFLDLQDIDHTASVLWTFRPDIIFCAATLLAWSEIARLPTDVYDKVYEAQAGPWLPMSLALVYKLMQAVRQTGLAIHVINASYPDAVNPVLAKVGLAPTTGVGNLANNIPALRKAVSLTLGIPLEQIDIRLVAQHYASHKLSRTGNMGGAPYHVTVLLRGEDRTSELDMQEIFGLLPTRFRRQGGIPGLLMTVASTLTMFGGMSREGSRMSHAPGPNGLPGGYPVLVSQHGVEVVLPESLSRAEAIQINEVGQRFDGIEAIGHNATVSFTEASMTLMREAMGYSCRLMSLDEVDECARELHGRYLALVDTRD